MPVQLWLREVPALQEGKVVRVARAEKLGQAGVPLRLRRLHTSNRNPESSKGGERAAKAENEDMAENEDKAESKASTRATSSDLPRARIPREHARRNLKT